MGVRYMISIGLSMTPEKMTRKLNKVVRGASEI
jgi:hypothetical protein